MVEMIGGPDRDRTDDLFHAMEARSQLRHRPTLWKALFLFSLTVGFSSNHRRRKTRGLPMQNGFIREYQQPFRYYSASGLSICLL